MLGENLIIYHHLGLGDHIVCNGVVRHFSEPLEIELLCKKQNVENVEFMYRDNNRINIVSVVDDNDANRYISKRLGETEYVIDVLRIGFAVGGQKHSDCLWDENFYRNAGVDFEYSWSKFYVKPPEKAMISPPNNPYIFVHSTGSHKIDRIDYDKLPKNKEIIFSDSNIKFFDYHSVIQNADEIHCINSSFKHLVDRIETKGKLFYHTNVKRDYDEHNSKKDWIIL